MKYLYIFLVMVIAIVMLAVFVIPTIPVTKQFSSDQLTERVVVVDVVYTPATHGRSSGTGITINGDIVFNSAIVNTEPIFATVFQCVHAKYIVEDSAIWAHAHVGDTAQAIYVEEYECEYRKEIPTETPRLVGYHTVAIIFGKDTIINRS